MFVDDSICFDKQFKFDIADDAFEGCNRATFCCGKDSYAEKYAKTHGFNVINMEL